MYQVGSPGPKRLYACYKAVLPPSLINTQLLSTSVSNHPEWPHFGTSTRDTKGTQDQLQALMQAKLPELLVQYEMTAWNVTWGPKVWKDELTRSDPNTGPDNTWFVARNPNATYPGGETHDTYVVSIAGTASTYGWLVEDFTIERVVDLIGWIKAGLMTPPSAATNVNDATGTYIALGTAGGVSTLLTQKAPIGIAGAGTNIAQYLATLPPSSRVIFTGHSLGAALAPTLAVSMMAAGMLTNVGSVLTYGTAGPTPGNNNFAKMFAAALPLTFVPRSAMYNAWNLNLWNNLDVVPQAWSTTNPNQNMNRILSLYGPIPVLSELWDTVYGAIKVASWLVGLSGIEYAPLQSRAFTGDPVTAVPTNWTEFKNIAADEHSRAYMNFIRVQLATPLYSQAAAAEYGVQIKTAEERASDLPFINLVQVSKAQQDEENGGYVRHSYN